MAIYSCRVQTISRSKGRSATAAAAYRSGTSIEDIRTGEIHNYTNRNGVEMTGIVLPENSPRELYQRENLWNAAEQTETRKNSTGAREEKIKFSIKSWQELIRVLARSERNELVAGLLKKLLFLTYQLVDLRSKNSPVKLAPRLDEFVVTKKLNVKTGRFCKLCWRPTLKDELVAKEGQFFSQVNASGKFCRKHVPGDDASWSNYIRDRLYLSVFENELELMSRWESNGSNFYPSPVKIAKRVGILNEIEKRKLIYSLVTSGLTKERPRKILKMCVHGCSPYQIADVLNLKISTVYYQVANIKKKYLEIFGSLFIDFEKDIKLLTVIHREANASTAEMINTPDLPTEKNLWGWLRGCL